MKNFFKFLGIISMALVIGFSMTGCPTDDDIDGGDPNTGGGGSGLTITNIPSSVTGYVTGTAVYGTPPLNLVANDGSTLSRSNMKAAAIANGKATLNAFDAGKTYPLPKFTGTASYNSVDVAANPPGNAFMIFVYAVEEPYTSSGFGYQKSEVVGTVATYQLKAGKTLKFTNGKATLDWNDLEASGTGGGDDDTVISIAAIEGVTAPVQGATPVTAITANAQYTGTVTWNGTPATFAYDTVYTATITLTAKTGYTLQGVTEDFFTVAGADSVSNAANSGIVTAVFPQTEDDPSLLHLSGDVTISPNTDAKTHTPLTATYSGSEAVSFQWQKNGDDIGTASTTNPNTYTPTEEGSYTVIVSLDGYNSKSATVTVTTADLSGDITISPNTGVTVGTPLVATYSGSEEVSFQWENKGDDIGTASTENPNTYTPNTIGHYSVTVRAAGYNPKTSDLVTVTIPDLAGNLTITVNGSTVTTATVGQTLTAAYSGSESVNYQWKKGEANVGTGTTYTPEAAGAYTVTISATGYNPKTSAPVTVTAAYTVTFDADNGTAIAPQTVAEGSAATKPTPDPIKDGHDFVYWFDTATDAEWAFTAPVTANLDLKAKWEAITLTGITAAYSGPTVAQTTPIEDLKAGLTVTAQYSNNTSEEVTDYELTGSLTITGPSTITVTWGGATTTFTVTAFAPTFTTAANMTTFLSDQEANTADTPYNIKLNVATNPWTAINAAQNAFSGKYVNLDLSGSTFTSTNSTFNGCALLTGITLPASVTTIGNYTFQNCTGLTDITIPSGVTSIATYAFNGCTGLTGITIPSGVTSIGTNAFRGCTGLTGITIPSGVTSISANAFNGCTSLASITIPEGLTTINDNAFNGCTSLTSIAIPASVTTIANGSGSPLTGVFKDCTSLTSVTFAEGSKLTAIGAYAFKGCTSLADITIPEGVTTISTDAFNGCTSLTSITIPASVTSIANGTNSGGVFGNTSLTSVTFAEGSKLTTIGEYAFFFCRDLTSITIPASVTTIRRYAFSGGSSSPMSLQTIIFAPGSQLTSIEISAFQNCTSLTSITIPASVTSIGSSAFDGCTGLTSVTFEGTIADTTSAWPTSYTPFPGDLRTKYFAATGGGSGTYIVTSGTGTSKVWTKQP